MLPSPNGFYTGVMLSQALVHCMRPKYANLERLALSLVNGRCRKVFGAAILSRLELYAGIRVSQAPIHRMSSKYVNLELLALFLANGHCHSTWREKRLKHEFQSGMLPAVHGICPKHAHNVPKLRRDFVLILVLRIVATITATGNDPNYLYYSSLLRSSKVRVIFHQA